MLSFNLNGLLGAPLVSEAAKRLLQRDGRSAGL